MENPLASETDDLECFYGMCHTWLGPYFTLKDFKLKWRKIVRYVLYMYFASVPSDVNEQTYF